ncbi:MAG: hypothetical protein FWH52_01820 [Synergistaceae bacterium]|nr:hypothetical protein [Synergistaceae bacterium]
MHNERHEQRAGHGEQWEQWEQPEGHGEHHDDDPAHGEQLGHNERHEQHERHERHEQHEQHDHHDLYGLDVEPAIVSFSQQLAIKENSLSGVQLQDKYREIINGLCSWAKAKSLLIGHIKLHIKAGDCSIWISTTGDGISIKKFGSWDEQTVTGYELSFTAIVFGISKAELLEICKVNQLF